MFFAGAGGGLRRRTLLPHLLIEAEDLVHFVVVQQKLPQLAGTQGAVAVGTRVRLLRVGHVGSSRAAWGRPEETRSPHGGYIAPHIGMPIGPHAAASTSAPTGGHCTSGQRLQNKSLFEKKTFRHLNNRLRLYFAYFVLFTEHFLFIIIADGYLLFLFSHVDC